MTSFILWELGKSVCFSNSHFPSRIYEFWAQGDGISHSETGNYQILSQMERSKSTLREAMAMSNCQSPRFFCRHSPVMHMWGLYENYQTSYSGNSWQCWDHESRLPDEVLWCHHKSKMLDGH